MRRGYPRVVVIRYVAYREPVRNGESGRDTMTNHCQSTNGHVADYHAPEPSVPATHDSFELTDDTVIIYRRESSRQWILADEAVRCVEHR